jgi:hypothetical protein
MVFHEIVVPVSLSDMYQSRPAALHFVFKLHETSIFGLQLVVLQRAGLI